MRNLVIVLVALTLFVGVAEVATANGPGGACKIQSEPFLSVGGTDTPLDGTDVDRPTLECYY